jgi:hypothetical protein
MNFKIMKQNSQVIRKNIKKLKRVFGKQVVTDSQNKKTELNSLKNQPQKDITDAFNSVLSNDEFVFDKYSIKPHELLSAFHAEYEKRINNLKKIK